MSLFGKIAAAFGGGSTRSICVVDGDRLAGGDRIGPGERFNALSRLSRFATREELDIRVVFGGRALREAADGDTYNGVQVYYGETPGDVRTRLGKLLSSAGCAKAVLFTGDQALEAEWSDKGYTTMRTSTLRKAMEASSGEGIGSEGGDQRSSGRGDRGDGGRGRHRGRNRGGPRRQSGDSASGSTGPAPANPQINRGGESGGSSAGSSDQSVKSLIDLVE